MTQPFTWPTGEWGGGANVFDVRSYGATPADVGIGVQGALNAALAAPGGGTIYIPRLDTTVWTWVTNVLLTTTAQGKNIRIQGDPGTIIQLKLANTGSYAFYFQNDFYGLFTASHLTFLGVGDGATPDCASVLAVGFCDIVSIQDCSFFGVLSGVDQVGILSLGATQSNLVLRCKFNACGSFQTHGGCVYASASHLTLDGCAFSDFGQLNAFFPGTIEGTSWVYVAGSSECRIVNCFFDEDQNAAIVFNTLAGLKPGVLTVQNCRINEANSGIGVSPATVKVIGLGLQTLVVRDCRIGLAGAGRSIVDLTNVAQFTLENIQSDSAGGAGQLGVTSRAGNGAIDIRNVSGTITPNFITYPSTRYTVEGIDVPYRVNHAGSPYVLLPSQLNVLADVSGGAIALTVPQTTTVPDGRRLTLAVPTGDASVSNITLNRAGADILQDPANIAAALGNSVTYATKGGSATWEACATEQQWRVVSKAA